MTASQLYHRLALERCRMYVAQLCAASHFDTDNITDLTEQRDMIAFLLKGLSQDLEVLGQAAGEEGRSREF
ncbi:MAG: hypothetical protein R3E13_03990 [Alphaproteobacteria bacterium]